MMPTTSSAAAATARNAESSAALSFPGPCAASTPVSPDADAADAAAAAAAASVVPADDAAAAAAGVAPAASPEAPPAEVPSVSFRKSIGEMARWGRNGEITESSERLTSQETRPSQVHDSINSRCRHYMHDPHLHLCRYSSLHGPPHGVYCSSKAGRTRNNKSNTNSTNNNGSSSTNDTSQGLNAHASTESRPFDSRSHKLNT